MVFRRWSNAIRHHARRLMFSVAVGSCLALPPWLTVCAQTNSRARPLHTTQQIVSDATLTNIKGGHWHFGVLQNQSDDSGTPQMQPLPVPTANLIRWGSWPGITREQAVWLIDGSWICGTLSLSQDIVQVENDWTNCPDIPLELVRGIVWNPPATLATWNALKLQLEEATGKDDRVWFTSGRKLAGILRWDPNDPIDETEPFTIDVSNQAIEFMLDDVQAILFSPALVGSVPNDRETTGSGVVTLGLQDGSLLLLQDTSADASRPSSTKHTSAKHIDLHTLAGISLRSYEVPAEFSKGVCFLNHRPDSTKFLSQLDVASYRHLSDSLLSWNLGRNRDAHHRPLMVDHGLVQNGLAMHSASRAAFRWDGSAARFRSEVRFAEPQIGAPANLGSVNCQILVARAGKFTTAMQFELQRNSEFPEHLLVDVDLMDAQLLVLVVDEHDRGQSGDHILWLDARIDR